MVQAELLSSLSCTASDVTWTDSPGANEDYPINCVTWYAAFAFCIWDGGRLPTEAEWEYAAAGGDENRVLPWGNDVTEPLPANYSGTDASPHVAVGSYPAGSGLWGHADLAGSAWEWMLDWQASDWYATSQTGCVDCANLTPASARSVRGGGWSYGAEYARVANRGYYGPENHFNFLGFPCARDVP